MTETANLHIKSKVQLLLVLFFLLLPITSFSQSDSVQQSLIEFYSLDELINLKVITADKHEASIDKVPASMVILSKKDIENSGYTTINELLRHITGYYQIEDHYWLGSSNFGVRGYFKNGPFSNISILVNGVNQLSDKYSDYPDVKITVPIEAIERIEIVKGPMAVIYGNGAFFGAINIITDATQLNQSKSNLFCASSGSGKTYKTTLKLSSKLEDFDYNVIFSADKSNGISFPYTNMTSDTALMRYVGLNPNSKTENHLSYSRYFANIRLGFKGITCDIAFNQSIKGVYDGLPSINNGTKLGTDASNFILSYKRKISDNFNLNASFSFFTHGHLLNYSEFRKYYYEIDMQRTNAIEYDLNTQWKISEKLNLISGIYRRTTLGITQISDFGYYGLNFGDGKIGLPEGENYSTTALFSQFSFAATNKLSFIGGLRLEKLDSYNMYYSRGVITEDSSSIPGDPPNRVEIEAEYKPENGGFTFIPRAGVIYNPSGKHFFKLMYGEAQKQPSFSENYRQLPKNRPQLNKSEIQTVELNYYSTFSNKIVLNSSLFYNQLNNLISLTNVLNANTGEWDIYSSNSGKINTFGAEINLKYQVLKKLSVELSGIYQKSKDLRLGYENIKLAYSPDFLGNARFLYLFSGETSLAALFHYVGEMETEWETDSTPELGYRLSNKTKGYLIADINFRKENLLDKNLYLNLKIMNIFNKKYFYPTTESNAWIDKGVPGERIGFLLSAGIKF